MASHAFSSVLGGCFRDFLEEKRACGYRYRREAEALRSFDRHLVGIRHRTRTMPDQVVDSWLKPHQSPRTQRFYFGVLSELARFMKRQGLRVQIPNRAKMARIRQTFVPRVFTKDEVRRFIAAVDGLGPDARSPRRGLIFATLFRLLYCCGLRAGEALSLTAGDVDLQSGVIVVRQGKFRQDRLVPITSGLLVRLRRYTTVVDCRGSEELFFQTPRGRQYSPNGLRAAFLLALRAAAVPHGGRGRGPRIHDLRHTFAVHRLEAWYREGVDLSTKLPVLATYLGHTSLAGTQRYLRLTAAVFPEMAAQLENRYGHLLPGGRRE